MSDQSVPAPSNNGDSGATSLFGKSGKDITVTLDARVASPEEMKSIMPDPAQDVVSVPDKEGVDGNSSQQGKDCATSNAAVNPSSLIDMSVGTGHTVSTSKEEEGISTRTACFAVVVIFGLSCLGLFAVYLAFPEMKPDERPYVKLPTSLEDAKNLGRVLSNYTETNFYMVLMAFFCTYIFLQSFAIPGSIFLSFLSGFLFPFVVAVSTVCLCSAIGASLCYLISYCVGRKLVLYYLPEQVSTWRVKVQKNKDNLLFLIIFLRITPILPNWSINIVSPVIDVPLKPFFLGTLIGVAPPSFLAIQAGTTLHQMTSANVVFTLENCLLLALFAVVSLVPILFKSKLKNKIQ